MTLPFAIVCIAAVALVAYATSALVVLASAAVAPFAARLCAAARARALLVAAALPAAASSIVLVAVLGPATGLVVDHCPLGGMFHSHAHLCASHPLAELPPASLVLGLAAAVLVARVALALARLAWNVARGAGIRRAIDPCASSSSLGVRVLPWDAPNAFVLGVLAPSIYVTRGLLEGRHVAHSEAVLAHERSHVRRRDALRRALAGVALAFHLPGVARGFERALATAHEMAADADAAVAVGSGERVARALVDLARSAHASPSPALAFGATELEARVRALLDDRERLEWPTPGVLAAVSLVAGALLVARAAPIHHGLEHFVAFFLG